MCEEIKEEMTGKDKKEMPFVLFREELKEYQWLMEGAKAGIVRDIKKMYDWIVGMFCFF